MTRRRIAVFAAHPDDETLGCGGSIARHVSDGDEVLVVICGEGIMARHPSAAGSRDDATAAAQLDALRVDARRAVETELGARLQLLSLPDNQFDSLPLLEVIKRVEAVKAEFDPDVVYTHHPGDLNIDHRVLFDAVLTAFRPLPGSRLRELLCFEVPSSSSYNAPWGGRAFEPTVYVDIEQWLDSKLRAMESYRTERREWPHPRSARALRALAEVRGAEAGMAAAEAFQLVRAIRQ
jgi:N-acetylglucosamine malate deacetylase 1